MTLYLIGLGLFDAKDISIRGLEIVRSCDLIYLEGYTSLLSCSLSELKEFYGDDKEIILADRAQSEQNMDEIISSAREKDVAFLVIGDPVSATTHMEIYRAAKEQGISVSVIHNASVFSAIGITGLQPYKFGKTTSIPFLDDFPQLETPYRVIQQNKTIGAHTLCLLDIKADQDRFMTVNQGIDVLLDIESRLRESVITNETIVIGCARLGHDDFVVKYGPLKDVKKHDFGGPLHSLIVPGNLHFIEEEILEMWKVH